MIYHWICNNMGATCGARPGYLSGTNGFTLYFSGFLLAQVLDFCVVFCISLFVLLSSFFWPLYCLPFDLRILITPFWYLQSLLFKESLYYIDLLSMPLHLIFSKIRQSERSLVFIFLKHAGMKHYFLENRKWKALRKWKMVYVQTLRKCDYSNCVCPIDIQYQ